jgi:hypothetical protein
MSINKSELLQSLKADKKSAETLKIHWDQIRAKYVSEWEGNPYGNEQEGRSAIVSKDIKKQSEWQHAGIIDPFVSTSNVVKCHPVTHDDVDSARQSELLLNTQFCRKFPRYNFMSKAIKVLDREGTVVVQTGWDYAEETIETEAEVVKVNEWGEEHLDTELVEESIVTRNQPTAKVCRNEDIYLDPTCEDDIDRCQFIVYRYETDISTLRKDGRYKNLDTLAKSLPRGESTYIPEDDTRFQFEDLPRKKIVINEYWGNYDVNEDGIAEPIVCAWANDIIIRLQDNPYPDGKPPFLIVPFNAVPFQMYGEANAEMVGDNQKVKTAVIRGIIDNMAQSNNGQVGIRKGALDIVNRKKWLQGKNFEFNGSPADFWEGNYNQIPGSAFDMIGLMNNEIESLTGVKSFSGGINGASLGSTATAARGAMDATSVRRMNIVRNISENLVKPLLRKWMAYNTEFLEEEEIIRITSEEFVPVRKDDLDGKVDIDLAIATAEDQAAKSQELSFLLQTLGGSIDPAITQEIMAQILDLSRMPEQAKTIRDYQPEPDPLAEEMKQLEIEKLKLTNEKLRSEALKNSSIAESNSADVNSKLSRGDRERAQADLFRSKADNEDLRFLEQDSGIDYERRKELEAFKHKAKLDEKAFDGIVNDTE